MIQMGTMLTVADNSGAKKICCILPLGGGVGKIAQLGDVITASVKEVIIMKDGEPDGTRVFGPVARELRERKYMKIVSLAPEVL